MTTLKNKVGWLLIIIINVIPVIIWLSSGPAFFLNPGYKTLLISLGQLTAIIGIMFLAIAIILSGRFKVLENIFGDISNIQIAHEILGGVGTLLLLGHPLFLALDRGSSSLMKGVLFMLPRNDLAPNLGIAALILLLLLVFLTYFVKLRYNIWKYTHQFLGIVLVLGLFHMVFAPSNVYEIKVFIAIWSFIGIAVYLYRTILSPVLVQTSIYIVKSVTIINDGIVEVKMEPKNKPLHFLPGQFVFISFKCNGIPLEVHPFSITSDPQDKMLSLDIKSLGDYTAHISALQPGSEAKIEGPFGRFLEENSDHQIWIAGGIGIAPFLSKLNSLRYQRLSIDLYYVVHTQEEAVHVNDLLDVAKNNPHFRVRLYDSSKEGHLTAEIVQTMSGNLKNKHIYICGPPAMEKDLKKHFQDLKIPSKYLHTNRI